MNMTTGYSNYTRADARKEIGEMRKFTQELVKSPGKAQKLLIEAGILRKSGRGLAKKYQSAST
ncbi:MAG: hypothetical protein HC904_00730 [Blastochloris sp.]|nr:hypothetical protein [Blastochloris sp.]